MPGPRRKCYDADANVGRKRAAARVKAAKQLENHAPRIDGRIPRRRATSSSRRTRPIPREERPPWDDRAVLGKPLGGGNGLSRSNHSITRSETRKKNGTSQRFRVTDLVERSDGEAIVTFQRRSIVCNDTPNGGESFLTSTGSSPLDVSKMKRALLDVCEASPPKDKATVRLAAASEEEREEDALNTLEQRLLELETAEDIIRLSLGDFILHTNHASHESEGCTSKKGDSETKEGLIDELDVEKQCEEEELLQERNEQTMVTMPKDDMATSENSPPTLIDVSLDKVVAEKLIRYSKAYKYLRRRIEEPLARSGLAPVAVVEMAVDRIIEDEIARLANEIDAILINCSENTCANL